MLVVHQGVEGGDMGREEERDIRKAVSLPWPRNDGVRYSISMARSREAKRGERSRELAGEREGSGGRE